MRNATRAEIPKALQRNAPKWTQKLLEALVNGDKKKIALAQNKYNHKEVKNTLITMYKGHCCYCEGHIREVSWGQIDHLKPIEKYPESGFDWNNLNLSCERCNGSKSNQYDEAYPILDPTGTEPINDHLDYHLSAEKAGLSIKAKSNRGATTINHTDLDRQELCTGRGEVLNKAWELKNKLNKQAGAPINEQIKGELLKLKEGRFGSVVGMVFND